MVAEATYRRDSDVLNITAAAGIASGEILQLADGRAAVYAGLNAAASGAIIAVQKSGVHRVYCAAATPFAAGVPVFWDASASAAVAPSAALDGAADFYLGIAVTASGSSQAFVDVDLNAGWTRLRPFVYEFDTETDTTNRTLIPASMNPSGLQILSVIGIVTEVFVGATQDQGIVTIYDNATSPATICTLTAADASGDAVQDVLQAAGQANAIYSASGVLTVKVAAGLAVTGTVTQVTSGTGAAGKMRVHVLATPLA